MSQFTFARCEALVNTLLGERIHGSLDPEEQETIEEAVEAIKAYAAMLVTYDKKSR